MLPVQDPESIDDPDDQEEEQFSDNEYPEVI